MDDPRTGSGGWDLHFNCPPLVNHAALEAHASEELRNVICRLCDAHTFVDSINRHHLLTVGQLLWGGGRVQQVADLDAWCTYVLYTHVTVRYRAHISRQPQIRLSELWGIRGSEVFQWPCREFHDAVSARPLRLQWGVVDVWLQWGVVDVWLQWGVCSVTAVRCGGCVTAVRCV